MNEFENIEELSDLSSEQINELYGDFLEMPYFQPIVVGACGIYCPPTVHKQ